MALNNELVLSSEKDSSINMEWNFLDINAYCKNCSKEIDEGWDVKELESNLDVNKMLKKVESSKIKQKSYQKGFIDGIRRFAHWKDGVQLVGTTGKTLKSAIEEIKNEGDGNNY